MERTAVSTMLTPAFEAIHSHTHLQRLLQLMLAQPLHSVGRNSLSQLAVIKLQQWRQRRSAQGVRHLHTTCW